MDKAFVPADFIPVLVQFVVAFGFVAITMTLTHIIGGKRKKIHTVRKDENFECGIEIKGNARFPFSVQYFLIAILFVLFDVEIIFFYPWAVNFREFGLDGFWEMLLFLSFLMFGFFYIIKKGALEWNK
jgi:NADH-quinone oxidoreductase subunit A